MNRQFKMNNIPLIAYGTWVENFKDRASIAARVKKAIEFGYTHIDTAHNYGTEEFVLSGFLESGVPRNSIYITSKLQSLMDSTALRKKIGQFEYYDLLLLHYPPIGTNSRAEFKRQITTLWKGMQSYVQEGLVKSIGISNFYQNHLDILLEVCDENNFIRPLVNQIEIHPGNLELEYVPYMQDRGIIPFAHTPLGGLGAQYLLNNDILIQIGSRIGATPAQVVLAYLLKRNIGIVTSSRDYKRMAESISIGEFIELLTEDDVMIIGYTDMSMGPMIEGSITAWDDNMKLLM